jgi:hypothetical protein
LRSIPTIEIWVHLHRISGPYVVCTHLRTWPVGSNCASFKTDLNKIESKFHNLQCLQTFIEFNSHPRNMTPTLPNFPTDCTHLWTWLVESNYASSETNLNEIESKFHNVQCLQTFIEVNSHRRNMAPPLPNFSTNCAHLRTWPVESNCASFKTNLNKIRSKLHNHTQSLHNVQCLQTFILVNPTLEIWLHLYQTSRPIMLIYELDLLNRITLLLKPISTKSSRKFTNYSVYKHSLWSIPTLEIWLHLYQTSRPIVLIYELDL